MHEKISDIPIREEKVKRLKEKISKEIERFSKDVKRNMNVCLNNKGDDCLAEWKILIFLEYSLIKLKEFIEREDAFQSYVAKYNKQDLIIYNVSDDLLNIYLQDEYNFVHSYIFNFSLDKGDIRNTYVILNDRVFGREFVTVFEMIEYEERMRNENKK